MSSNSIIWATAPSGTARYVAYAVGIGVTSGVAVTYGGWLGVVGILGMSLLLRWPVQVALGSFALLLPFDSVSALGSGATGTALTRYVGGFAAVVLLVTGLWGRRISVPPRAALWWSLFVLWGVATLGWAANSQFVWERMPTALSLLLFYIVATGFRIKRNELSVVLVMTVLGGCIAAVFSAYQFYHGTVYEQTTRSSLMMGNRDTDPNQFGASLLLPFSLAIGAMLQGRTRIVRLAAGLATAVLSLAVLLSMSRGAMVAAVAVVLVYIWRLGWNRRIVLALTSVSALLLVMPHSFFTRLGLSDRGAGRLDIWMASMHLLPRYGFFGAGWNNFIVAYTGIAGHAPSFRGYTRGSHNIYIGMLIEVGIVGLIFLLLAFWSQLRKAATRALIPYEAACWAMLVMGFTLDIVWRKSFWFAWILLAMAVCLRNEDTHEGATS
jgi:hypothetical protein